ncbi:MAG: SDR family NAD(P)-dependent oxidoreductase [Rhodoblastus sp.]
MIDLNIRSLTTMAHQFLPDLRATRGGMLNVASVAAYGPGPNMAIYYASKAYVLSFSEALSEEMRPSGVRVCSLPRPVATGFRRGRAWATGAAAGKRLSDARETVTAGYDGLMAGRRVLTPGLANRALVAGLAWIPHSISLPRMAAQHAGRRGGAGK